MENSIAIYESELDSYNSDNVLSDEEEQKFDEWFLQRCLRQLCGAHSAPMLRMDVQHWVFKVPFVTREYAEPHIRLTLVAAADRYKEMVERGSMLHDPKQTHSVRIRHPDDQDVAFRISEEFEVIPYRFSFEAVCLRLMVDPDEMREQIRFRMNREGITQLIEQKTMAVRDKCERASQEQTDLFGVDFEDVRMFITPMTVTGPVSNSCAKPEISICGGDNAQSSLF